MSNLRADIERMVGGGSFLRTWIRALVFPNTRAVIGYRVGHWFATHHMLPVAYLIRFHVLKMTGADINPLATIGSGFELIHTSGVVIGADVIIGKNVWVAHGVTIGCGSKPGQPVVGNGVQFGCGSSALGGITIGDNAAIACNTVVTRDVLVNEIVFGSRGNRH